VFLKFLDCTALFVHNNDNIILVVRCIKVYTISEFMVVYLPQPHRGMLAIPLGNR